MPSCTADHAGEINCSTVIIALTADDLGLVTENFAKHTAEESRFILWRSVTSGLRRHLRL